MFCLIDLVTVSEILVSCIHSYMIKYCDGKENWS
jgi:hypothetical protein